MKSNPSVSIVVCTYNGERYLAEQIDSLFHQTYPISEIIIQDDCSSDHTWDIILQYVSQYPNVIKGIRNIVNLGWNQNFYDVILKAKGDYIALCDQDDVWSLDKIEKQIIDITLSDKLIHVCSSNIWKNDSLTPRYSVDATLGQHILFPYYCGHQMLISKEIKQFVSLGQDVDMAHDRFFSLVGSYMDTIYTSKYLLVNWRRHSSTTTGELRKNISGGGDS